VPRKQWTPRAAVRHRPPERRVATDVARRRRDRTLFAVATPIGALLVIAGQVGARTGWISIPGDPHHYITQIAGVVVLLFGLTRWR